MISLRLRAFVELPLIDRLRIKIYDQALWNQILKERKIYLENVFKRGLTSEDIQLLPKILYSASTRDGEQHRRIPRRVGGGQGGGGERREKIKALKYLVKLYPGEFGNLYGIDITRPYYDGTLFILEEMYWLLTPVQLNSNFWIQYLSEILHNFYGGALMDTNEDSRRYNPTFATCEDIFIELLVRMRVPYGEPPIHNIEGDEDPDDIYEDEAVLNYFNFH